MLRYRQMEGWAGHGSRLIVPGTQGLKQLAKLVEKNLPQAREDSACYWEKMPLGGRVISEKSVASAQGIGSLKWVIDIQPSPSLITPPPFSLPHSAVSTESCHPGSRALKAAWHPGSPTCFLSPFLSPASLFCRVGRVGIQLGVGCHQKGRPLPCPVFLGMYIAWKSTGLA